MPLLIRSRTLIEASSGAPRSRALVTPASSSCLADAGMIIALELRQVGLVPVRVVAVAVEHEMHVHVPEAGQHAHALGGDHLGAARHRAAVPTVPTALMRSPSTRMTLLRSGGRRSRRSACRRPAL